MILYWRIRVLNKASEASHMLLGLTSILITFSAIEQYLVYWSYYDADRAQSKNKTKQTNNTPSPPKKKRKTKKKQPTNYYGIPTKCYGGLTFNNCFTSAVIKQNGVGQFCTGTGTLTYRYKECNLKLQVWVLKNYTPMSSQPAMQIRYHHAHMDD